MNRAAGILLGSLVLTAMGALPSPTMASAANGSFPAVDLQETAMTSLTIQGPQGQLAVIEAGQDEDSTLPVLFLHADSGRASQWADILGRIGRDRRVVAFDFRGTGTSDPATDGDYSYAGRAADIAAVADSLDLDRFVIVAHSGGGAAALHYAVDRPDRVAGLLLVDPATDPRALPQAVRDGFVKDLAGPQSLDVQQAFYRSIAGLNPAVRDRVVADTEAVDPAARAGHGKALATWNPEPTLNAWQGPILILASTANDTPDALYRLRPDVQHRVIAESGHWLQLDQPDIVEQAIRGFIAEIEQENT